VRRQLEEMGQLDNTLIIFTSDQGFAWGQHGCRHKFAPYDANILAPMIVRMPGVVDEGVVCDKPIAGQDIVPMIHHFAGLEVPWEMHGHDMTPLLTDQDAEWDHPILMENLRYCFGEYTDVGCGEAENGIPWWLSLRQGKYKYIRWLVHGEIEELYDLEADPQELHNLALEAEYHELLADYRERLRAELRRTNAGLVDNLPPVHVTTAEKLFAVK